MSDQRSVMKEFRFLDQKRQTTGLSAVESARYAQLRDLVGPDTTATARAGFDVGAATARLRESLLPGGLRGQPPAAPPPEPVADLEPEVELSPAPEAVALEAAWADQPFAPLESEAAPDPLFDPASMGTEVRPQAWNPEAPGYDPDAPFDEAAWIAAGYDPNATYDWSAYQGADGTAAQAEPAAPEEAAGASGLEEALLDAAPSDAGAWQVEAAAEPIQLEGTEQAAAPEPEPEPEPELPFDPNAPFDHAKWFGRPSAEAAPAGLEAAPEPFDLASAAQAAQDAWPPAEVAAPLEILEEEAVLEEAAPEPVGQVGAASPESWFEAATEPPPAPALAFGDYDGDARGAPAGLAAAMAAPLPEPPLSGEPDELPDDGSATPFQPAPAGAPFGEYDEAAPVGGLPFDPAAVSAIEPGELPEGYDAAGPSIDPATLPPIPGGDHEPAFAADAGYGGPEGDSLPGGEPLELGAPVQDWQPEQALEQGFQLASNGSFGELERPAVTPVPGWARGPAAAPEGWESPPALDLAAPFDLGAPAVAPQDSTPADELPTLGVEDILEEVEPVPVEPEAAETAALEPAQEPAGEPLLVPVEPEAAPAAFGPPAEPLAPAWEPPAPPAAEEIPPEIAAAFGDAPDVAPPAAFHAEPPPDEGRSSAAGEPEPVHEEAPPPALQEQEPVVEPEPLPEPGAGPQVWIEGSHRVVLHTVDGQVKRGLLVDAPLDALDLVLQPQGPGVPEMVPTEGVKAIFFMLAPGEKAATPEGRKVRVTFRDGRQVAGYSPDYQEGTVGFFMIPADTRTNTGRIWVYQGAVRQVSVS